MMIHWQYSGRCVESWNKHYNMVEVRHKRMIAIFAMLMLIVIGLGSYLIVAFYFKHIWSLLFVATFLFLGFTSPMTCYGYSSDDADHNRGNMELSSYKNCRDLGYVSAVVFALLTYLVPSIAWLASDGTNPTLVGTLFIYMGNTSFIWSFASWLRIFMLTSTNE